MEGGDNPRDPLRTALAAHGVELSALFFVVFEDRVLPGTPPRQPRLLAPPGQSTLGGKLARQHVALEPADGHEGPAVVAGWADPATLQAELRTFRSIEAAYARRFGGRLELAPSAYQRFLKDAGRFLREQGLTVRVAGSAPTPLGEQPRGSSWGLVLAVLGATLLLGMALGMGYVALFGD